ncbi:MAG TPA: histidinol dehydrogenase [bacterium]|jgi:histidinol dehydrogenase|nr:histidinol dehydrogenase [bacterium]
MRSIRIRDAKDLRALGASLRTVSAAARTQERAVAAILRGVEKRGDKALLAYARRFDGFKGGAKDLLVGASEVKAAYARVDKAFVKAIETVISNVRSYQARLKPKSWRSHLRSGVLLGQMVRPLRRVGLYVPGGEAPLVSTVLMTAVPASVAGVKELVLATPDRFNKGVDPRLLVAADMAGVKEILRVGGAQAIAALAYGTASVQRVDKIVGPGNSWVALAKKQVYGVCGIDMIAGPSEALVLADDSAPAEWVAADLLSQAEHAGDETAVLVTPSARLAKAVLAALKKRLKSLPRRSAATSSLQRHGLVVVCRDMELAVAVADLLAPEHLQLMVRDSEAWLPKLKAAGAIFVGPYTPVALGDFLAGPSHVLPTGGTARFSSGLSVEDFVTRSSLIGYSRPALEAALPVLQAIGGAEGLQAHVLSGQVRLPKKKA